MIEPRCYHACAVDGQYLYVTGGYSLLKRNHGEMIAISSTDRLNLIDRQWKSCTNMIMSRAAHALVSHKGYLYAFGGRNSQGSILASVEMYDPHQDLWIEITSLPQPTMGLSAICIMDSVWLIGGITDHTSKDPAQCLLSTVFSFIPSAKKWYEEISLPYACAFSSCISNDYALWLIGGCTASRDTVEETMTSCSSVLQLSFSEKPQWKSVASLLYPRHALTAVLHGECIYVLGGIESNNKCASDNVEVINTTGNISVVCTKMPVPIAGCTSVLIVSEKNDYRYIEEACDAFSAFNERISFKSEVVNNYSGENSKVSSVLDVNNMDENKCSPLMSTTDQLHNENLTETEKTEIEIPVTQKHFATVTYSQESFKVKDMFDYKINGLKAKNDKDLRYRTSMEICLDSDKTSPYTLKKESSRASKWLNYFEKLSSSDEKLHKEIFQSKETKLNGKTEAINTRAEEILKAAEVKHVKEDKKTDLQFSDCVPSQHKPFMYVKSSITEKSTNINLDQTIEDSRKETTDDRVKTDLKSDILCKHAPDEAKIVIDEDHLPIILLFGGEYSKEPTESRSIMAYYCNEDKWVSTNSSLPEYCIYHSAVLLHNKIYIIGGFRSENSKFNENITNKAMCYDIYQKVWHDVANMNHARAHHSAVVLEDKIYVLGGRSQLGYILSSVEVYDESCDMWKECKSLPYSVLGAAIFSLDNSIHVFGGITYEDDDEIISSNTAIYNTEEDVWTKDFEMPVPLAFCGIANNLDLVLLVGGLKIENDDLVSSKDVFEFNIVTKTWNKVAELSTPRLAPVTVSIEKQAYVIGGHSTQEKKEVLTCEVINLAKNEVSLRKDLPVGISGKAGVAITEM